MAVFTSKALPGLKDGADFDLKQFSQHMGLKLSTFEHNYDSTKNVIQFPQDNIPPQPNNRPRSTSNGGSPNNRGSSTTSKSPTNRSPTNRSPTNRSPTNRSPTNRSPTNRSPTNRSPTNRSPTNRSPTNRSPTNRSPTNIHKTPGSPISNLSGKNAFNRFFPHGTNGVQRPFPNHHVNQPDFSHHPHRSYENRRDESDYEELYYVSEKHTKPQNSRTQENREDESDYEELYYVTEKHTKPQNSRSQENREDESDYEELYYVPEKHPKPQNSRTQLGEFGNSSPYNGNVGPFAYNSPSYIYEGGRGRRSVRTIDDDDDQFQFGSASLGVSYYFGWVLVLAEISVLLFLGFCRLVVVAS